MAVPSSTVDQTIRPGKDCTVRMKVSWGVGVGISNFELLSDVQHWSLLSDGV